jgi:hypothetical protein
MAMTLAGLSWLASADGVAAAPAAAHGELLRGLEQAASMHTAARARVLAAFCTGAGYEADGHGSPRTWLTWQTRTSRPAANAALGWVRRLAAHSAVAAALGAAELSQSWAHAICEWTDQLPEDARADADMILVAAARGGADLDDLAALAAEIRSRTAKPDTDDGGFEDRRLRLLTTMGPLGGAGYLTGDLTPGCAAALRAVLDVLGKKRGPEDTRSSVQRDHDALEDAMRRLIASGCLPDRAGQPVQIQLSMSLKEMLARLGGSGADDSAAANENGMAAPADDDPGLPGVPAWPGAECDAAIQPVVYGRVDHDLLDRLDARAVAERGLAAAVALLSGPGQLASVLRTGNLPGPAASISLPLDLGKPTEVVPPHLRRAVIIRDKHCAAPGCDVPAPACHVHHIVPRALGGATKLTNLLLLCTFHHEIAVHRWGWTISLNPDGTTTMRSPGGRRTYHSHAPPGAAAA